MDTIESRSERERMYLWYRFHMPGYSLRGTNHWGPDDIVKQEPGSYAYPVSDSMPIVPVVRLVPVLRSK